MDRPPRDIKERFFGYKKIILSCMQGVGILVFVMGIYLYSYYSGHSEGQVRAMSFLTLIAANIAFIMSNRSWTRSIFELLTIRNKAAAWVIGSAAVFMILIMNIPFFLKMFQFEKPGIADALICVVTGLLTITWFEVYKSVKLRRSQINRHV
jgi:Ca2+-transporting ATPase